MTGELCIQEVLDHGVLDLNAMWQSSSESCSMG